VCHVFVVVDGVVVATALGLKTAYLQLKPKGNNTLRGQK